MVVSGCVGPRGDGYDPGQAMSPEDAAAYHGRQIRIFGRSRGRHGDRHHHDQRERGHRRRRARRRRPACPWPISFTLDTDGRLPTGQGLKEAVEAVDAATSGGPAYYMINCAHPTHFEETLSAPGDWAGRIRGLRANASRRSHQELNEAPDLDDGDPVELGQQYGDLLRRHPQINVLGGCCGTDHRHIEQIGMACRRSRDAHAVDSHRHSNVRGPGQCV